MPSGIRTRNLFGLLSGVATKQLPIIAMTSMPLDSDIFLSPVVPGVQKNADWIKKNPYLCSVHPLKLDHLMVLPLIKPDKLVSFYSILFLNPMTKFRAGRN